MCWRFLVWRIVTWSWFSLEANFSCRMEKGVADWNCSSDWSTEHREPDHLWWKMTPSELKYLPSKVQREPLFTLPYCVPNVLTNLNDICYILVRLRTVKSEGWNNIARVCEPIKELLVRGIGPFSEHSNELHEFGILSQVSRNYTTDKTHIDCITDRSSTGFYLENSL